MKRKLLFIAAALTLLLAACAPAAMPPAASPSASTPAVSAPAVNRPTVDREGNEIALPDEVVRIISMAPAITQILDDLGVGDRVVAMDTNSALLYAESPDMPLFDMFAPDGERLAELNPDLILASAMSMMGSSETDPFAPLKPLGICVAYIPTSETIADIKEDIRFIAAAVGRVAEGEALLADMEAEMAAIAALADGSSPTVYFEISPAPAPYSFGSGVFLNEMIELVGARNILGDQTGWLPVEVESVVAMAPEVIFTNVNFMEDAVGELLTRDGWGAVPAVANGRVYYVDNNATALPNHNIVIAVRQMAEALYTPEGAR